MPEQKRKPSPYVKKVFRNVKENIRTVRNYRGLTQRELAEKCGCAHQYISRIENLNTTSRPSLDSLAIIAEVLGIPAGKLIDVTPIDSIKYVEDNFLGD